jgi:hypothetical protein
MHPVAPRIRRARLHAAQKFKLRPAGSDAMTVSRLGAFVALAVCFVAGYFLAGWWSNARDTTPLAKISARVDYLNGLQESQDTPGDDVRTEVKALAEECRGTEGSR